MKMKPADVAHREQLVLYALYNKELYGMQIARFIEEASDGYWKMGVGTLYPVIGILEKKKLVVSRWGIQEGTRGGALPRYHKLTEKGQATVEALELFRTNLLHSQPSSEAVSDESNPPATC